MLHRTLELPLLRLLQVHLIAPTGTLRLPVDPCLRPYLLLIEYLSASVAPHVWNRLLRALNQIITNIGQQGLKEDGACPNQRPLNL